MPLLFSHTHFILVCEARKYDLEFSFFPIFSFQKIIKQYLHATRCVLAKLGVFTPNQLTLHIALILPKFEAYVLKMCSHLVLGT
jgi:hypothetical protein